MAEPESTPPGTGDEANGAPSSGTHGATGSTPPPSVPPPSGAAEAGAAPVEAPQDPLEVAKAEAQKYREQLLRTAADFDNFRKRARRDQDDAQRRGKEQSLKELLPVFDNLERAASSAETAPDAKSVADGLKMVLRQFNGSLEKLAIKRIPTVGVPFDPSLHEAIQHVHSAEHAPGVIAVEVQAGYTVNEHLLRAALVAVSKGPEEAPAAPDAGSETPQA